jgi:hypothetical protein
MSIITETRWKCDLCDCVSPVCSEDVYDNPPSGWIWFAYGKGKYLHFCCVDHRDWQLICNYCGKLGPEYTGGPLPGEWSWIPNMPPFNSSFLCSDDHRRRFCLEMAEITTNEKSKAHWMRYAANPTKYPDPPHRWAGWPDIMEAYEP